jgi:acyl-CoA synthetase (AMP-forming)/AMP-acid ligase II
MTGSVELPSFEQDTMAALFAAVASDHGSRPALVASGMRISFAELDSRTNAIAECLASKGLTPGSTVGALLHDGLAMVELLIATAKLGATLVTVNWRLAAPEIQHILEDSRPVCLFASDCHAALAREAGDLCRVQMVHGDDLLSACRSLPGQDEREDLREIGEISGDRDWILVYTSGTTGRPKGCRHTQRGYYINILSCTKQMGFRATDRALLIQPMFHVGGLHIFLSLHVAGSCVVIPPRNLDHETMLQLASQEAITFQTLPILDPRGYAATRKALQIPLSLRLMHAGGGMHPICLLDDISKTFNVDMMLGYGQTEGGGLLSLISLSDQRVRSKSCGKPLPHLDVRIVDDAGRDVSEQATGELLVRGASITAGYLHLANATAETIVQGWLHTGDLFWRDQEGFLYFAGRKKELIKSGGENVYPAEVELVIHGHPSVEKCCVAGVADDRFGEVVKAFVVLKRGQMVTPSDIANWCRGRIAGYKRPRFVEFIDSIPCDFQGKPQRAALSQRPLSQEQAADRG